MAETREEIYLEYLAGKDVELPTPVTRQEQYLYNLCTKGIGGGATSWSDLGESPTGGDTLTWDGNTEGLVSAADFVYKISDATPSIDDLANGMELVIGGETIAVTSDDIQANYALHGFIIALFVAFVIPSDNFEWVDPDGATMFFAEKGIYVQSVVQSLTIPGYTGFPSVNKVPEKYLPETTWDTLGQKSTVFLEETTVTITGDDYFENLTGEPIKGTTLTVVFNGNTYESTVFDVNGFTAGGNPAFVGAGENNGVPFALAWMNSSIANLVVTDETLVGTECTVKISGMSTRKIPAAYYDKSTMFYINLENNSDVYIYTDDALTNKATFSDLAVALRNGSILCSFAGMYVHTPVHAEAVPGGSGGVVIATGYSSDGTSVVIPTFKRYYTAEYTAS